MCKCGCDSCGVNVTPLMLNESLAPKQILSEGLKHHMDNNKPLTEHLYRAGSTNYFNLWAEARSLYSREILEITNEDDLAVLTETHLGHFGILEDGTKVPLDFPIELNEDMDIEDEIANMEFGMDYDQLGPGEKEWVRDEIDNMLNEEVNSEDLDNALYRLEKVLKYLDIEYKETRRGEKYIQINYIPVTSPQSYNPEFVNVRYNNDEDLGVIKKRLGLSMLNEESVNEDLSQKLNNELGSIAGTFAEEDINQDDAEFYDIKPGNYMKYYIEDVNNSTILKVKRIAKANGLKFAKDLDDMLLFTSTSINEAEEKFKVIDTRTGDIIDSDLPKNIAQKLAKKKKEWTSYPDREKSAIAKIAMSEESVNEGKVDWDNIAKEVANRLKKGSWPWAIKNGVENITPEDIGSVLISGGYTTNSGVKKNIGGVMDKILALVKESVNENGLKFAKDLDDMLLFTSTSINEAAKKKNTKKLNKPMRDTSGGKAYKVYVKDPKTGNIKTVRFGSGGLRAKINDKEARNAFAARHKCSTKKDKTKAGYWSCRLPRYAKLLGLKSNFNGFW